jgi:hypothetical protein
MAGYHIVKQGEDVPHLAWTYGFRDYLTIWNHPNNAALRTKRQNPNVLYPGDSVFIPDKDSGEYDKSTDKRHRFMVKSKPLKLRLVLKDQYEKPIANTACVLTVDDETKRLTTDGTGKVELTIQPSARNAKLVIDGREETPHAGTEIPIRIGHLDPVEEISGQQGRLKSLGYYWGEIDGEDGPEFRSAVEEFQCEQGLTVDGICGPITQSKLKQVYGC